MGKSLLTLIGKILGAVVLVSGAATVLWQVFAYTDNQKDHNKEVKETLDYLVRNDSVRCEESDTIIMNLQRLNSNVEALQGDFIALRRSYLHDQSEVLTPQEFLRLMEELGLTNGIKKNSGNNGEPTVSER